MRQSTPGPRTLALLGPTNSGKTHRAVERMLSHPTGMIGLPLRLLAREVYDRVSVRVGEQAAALVTGEEKRVPPRPSYWVCTVEAMPLDREVDFVAVDEVQLATHHQRGHVFTNRLLHLRGRRETWLLGADTMRPLVSELVPTAEVRHHARLSQLRHAGSVKLGALPRRSAIVAFSMDQVYELAERIRARRGGAAVVLGALSPRARNAQVALYQAGEVDYLVATDAIGMGLNLDIDHVAFAELAKFDGAEHRPLAAAELAQIAGRAGRHLNDGSFGTLAPVAELPPRVARDVENHRFPPARQLRWRNRELDFGSVEGLLASLRRRPGPRSLRLTRQADDAVALERLAADPEVRQRLAAAGSVPLLWEVCQIPDYRQLMLEDHVGLLKLVFMQLRNGDRRLDQDWMARRIERVAGDDGDIEDLLQRMAFIRTWTYISHRSAWVTDAGHWQERTRAVEDRLSDALHQRLLDRFVESSSKGSSPVSRRSHSDVGPLRDGSAFAVLARLARPQPGRRDGEAWLEEVLEAPFEQFTVDSRGRVSHGGKVLARLKRGHDLQRPEVVLVDGVAGGRAASQRLLRRLVAWARDLASEVVAPLHSEPGELLSQAVRGLVYQLECGLGTTSVRGARTQLRDLSHEDRALLERLGVRLGRRHVYLASGLEPAVVAHRVALCAAWWGAAAAEVQPAAAAVSLEADARFEPALYEAIGFPLAGGLAVRADVLERVSTALWRDSRRGPFEPGPRIHRLLGAPREAVASVVEALGYHPLGQGRFRSPRRRRRDRPGRDERS